MNEMERTLTQLLTLAERDPDRASAQFDILVALHGRAHMARVLQAVAGDELTTLSRRAA